ncbi:MAG: MBL fold metallo-hydrolase [Deltaproteobacteria bacterium]|nr:MBL fold metallo-hydrolase [Deltaproteobacteria bacterium]MBW2446610.1 MBL fold metallo-hydrolase [Deltaproteobacteria bacterium]
MLGRVFWVLAVVTTAAVVASVAISRLGLPDGIQQAAIRRMLEGERTDLFEDGRLHVFTLGTGSPQLGSRRMPVANAVIAGKEFLVLDAGEGASRKMGELQLPIDRVSAVFITHWHSDHFSGLGQILNQSWNADRAHEVDVYGPRGIDRVMGALADLYADDIHYRSQGEVERNDPRYALGRPVPIEIPDGSPGAVIFDRNGVVVRAFHVDHGHIEPAYGFRVEYAGRCVVVSGDTVASPLVAAAARDCDLLIHEALNIELIENAVVALRDAGKEGDAFRARGVIGYHADTIGVARVAAEANVGRLVLSHVIPATDNPILNRLFVRGMKEHFHGPIVVARDGQHFAP